MRQGGKNQWPGRQHTMGCNRNLAFFVKRSKERETHRKEKATQIGKQFQKVTSVPFVEGVSVVQPQLFEKCGGRSGLPLDPAMWWGAMEWNEGWSKMGQVSWLVVGGGTPILVRAFDSWVQCGPLRRGRSLASFDSG